MKTKQEGIIIANTLKSHYQVKAKEFYYTYNDRAETNKITNDFYDNLENEIMTNIKKDKTTGEYKVENTGEYKLSKMSPKNKIDITHTNPIISSYSTYLAMQEEYEGVISKEIELIFSYSRELNEVLSEAIGQEEYEKWFKSVTENMFKRFNKNSSSKIIEERTNAYVKDGNEFEDREGYTPRNVILHYHKEDSTGYRFHSHVKNYPFVFEETKKGELRSAKNPLIPVEELEKMKRKFQKAIVKKIKKVAKEGTAIQDAIKKQSIKIVERRLKKLEIKLEFVENTSMFNDTEEDTTDEVFDLMDEINSVKKALIAYKGLSSKLLTEYFYKVNHHKYLFLEPLFEDNTMIVKDEEDITSFSIRAKRKKQKLTKYSRKTKTRRRR